MTVPEDKIVREFRHMLLWPLQLRRLSRGCSKTDRGEYFAHESRIVPTLLRDAGDPSAEQQLRQAVDQRPRRD